MTNPDPWLPPVPRANDAPPPSTPAPAAGPSAERRIPIWSPFVVAIAAVIGATMAAAIYSALRGSDAGGSGTVIIATLVQNAVAVTGAVLVAKYLVGGASVAATLGLVRTNPKRTIGISLIVWLIFWGLSGLIVVILGEAKPQELANEIKNEKLLVWVVGYYVLTSLVAPLAEEILFRGLLFGSLRAWLGVPAGVIISSALFAAPHLPGAPAQALLTLFFLAAAFCLLYQITGSIIPAIGLHALNNSIAFAVTRETGLVLGVAGVLISLTITVAIAFSLARRTSIA